MFFKEGPGELRGFLICKGSGKETENQNFGANKPENQPNISIAMPFHFSKKGLVVYRGEWMKGVRHGFQKSNYAYGVLWMIALMKSIEV
ncbi:MAG: hypothetical protein NPIRA06_20710 [Nitrospirales bacterium]|nr:MAG: hypothetical protein NPIRA06_20710 [Nitrospirales bacterium]